MSRPILALKPKERKIFKNDDHASHSSTILRRFYEEKEFLDTVLIAGIDKFRMKAHRIVLSGSSDYLLERYRSSCSLKEAKSNEIYLEDVQGTSLKLIIDFIYTGSIELRSETIESVMRTAYLFKMNNLLKVCADFISEQLNPENCFGISLFAEQYGYTVLHKLARTFAFTHFAKVYIEKEFLLLNEVQLRQLLSSDDLGEVSQENVFHSVVAWIEHDKADREKFICSLLSLVRFDSLDPKFIIKNSKSVANSIECHELIRSWLEWHLVDQNPSLPSTDISESKKPNSKIYVITGHSTNNINVQTYNRQTNTWLKEEWPQPAIDRAMFGITVINKKAIIAGGRINERTNTNKVQYLDLETMKWTDLPSMTLPRCSPNVIELNGDLYVVGGTGSKKATRSVEKFDFSSRKWEKRSPLPAILAMSPFGTEIVALDGLLYAISCGIFTMQCYDPSTNKWTQKAYMNEAWGASSVAALNGYLYAVGGPDSKIHEVNLNRYDPLENTWSFVKALDQVRLNATCAALNNRLIVCGGFGGNRCTNHDVEEYDPENNEWKTLAPLPSAPILGFHLFAT